MIVKREMESAVKKIAQQFPVVTITGPRQSGKTTLVRHLFPEHVYYTLEDPDLRELALSDPRSFLDSSKEAIILDEIQKAPELLSYIQGIVDRNNRAGRFILTGSHQFHLLGHITQSLAGRTFIFKLLPFSMNESHQLAADDTMESTLFKGLYPGIYDKRLDPTLTYKAYFEMYIERDLRQIINIKDLRLFRQFVRLCAGRIGQILSLSNLSNDVGVSVPTIKSWISVLEASHILFLLEPYYENISKRLIKSPKLYFYDTGLAAYLLGIENENQMDRDPLKGNLFENLVIVDIIKKRLNIGLDHNCYFYRDSNQNEVDLVYKHGRDLRPIEIKAAKTFTSDFLKGLKSFKDTFPEKSFGGTIVYAGDLEKKMGEFSLSNYKNAASLI